MLAAFLLATLAAAEPALGAAGPATPRLAQAAVLIQTPRGTSRLELRLDPVAGPVVAGAALLSALNGTIAAGSPWTEVQLARQTFRFLLGAPLLMFNDRLEALSGMAVVTRDTLYLPLQFVAEFLPQVLSERYSWDPLQRRLLEAGPPVVSTTIATPPPPRPDTAPSRPVPESPSRRAAEATIRPDTVARLPNGLRAGHVIVLDPGHGGVDPGNPGLYFPRGIHEKDITLQIAVRLREELQQRGVRVIMTRTTDTLIARGDRAPLCTQVCDLFVSLHVDALQSRRGYREVRGFHTIIIGDENTEDADRIARMENEASQYEDPAAAARTNDLDFILGNLQMNEFLRESARAAELVQDNLDRVHTGDNRGVKQSNQLAVLNTARRPAILIEMGYSTNQRDAQLLVGRKSQQSFATAIADALVAWLLEYERKTGVAGGARGR